MHKPHLPTFAVTALSPPCAPLANPAIGRTDAPAGRSPAALSGIVGALQHPSLPGSQGWQGWQ